MTTHILRMLSTDDISRWSSWVCLKTKFPEQSVLNAETREKSKSQEMTRNMVCLALLLVAVGVALSDASGCVDTQYRAPCAGSCTFTCADAARQCSQTCIDGCKCPRRTPVLLNGKCIAKLDCPPQECTGGRVWKTKGSRCTPTCEKQTPECQSATIPRCECPANKPIWAFDECIRANECPPQRCGSSTYSSATHMCCGRTVNPLPEHPECCGKKAYNRLTHICCRGRLIRRNGTDEGCCGQNKFKFTTHMCCRGRIVRKSVGCP
ncbi:hypothetical protein LSAT2_012418 [Lamellibrachia satsuma]|nr:hypothetical protein LSAT2_012418 [Lamellibrachia satsuma]